MHTTTKAIIAAVLVMTVLSIVVLATTLLDDVGNAPALSNESIRAVESIGTEQTVAPQSEPQHVDMITVGVDRSASVLGVAVTPLEVVEDTRCMAGAACLQAGTIRVRAQVKVGEWNAEMVSTLDEAVVIRGGRITLTEVTPLPAGETIPTADYRMTYRIERT